MKVINEYYDFLPVQFEIVKNTQKRELSFLKGADVRALNLYRVDELKNVLKLVNYNTKKPNMYISLAKIRYLPQFTYNPRTRSNFTSEWFRGDFFNQVYEYDLFLDFDAKEDEEGLDEVYQELKEFKTWLDEYKLPYYIIFSGNRGFQVIIPFEFLPKGLSFKVLENGRGEKDSVYEFCKNFLERAKEVFALKHLDLAHAGVPNKLRKCPYSLVGDNVAFPLSDYDFDNFKVDNMKCDYILKTCHIKNRGLYLREHKIDKLALANNLNNFTMEFKLNVR